MEVWDNRHEIIQELNQWNLHSEAYTWVTVLWLASNNGFHSILAGEGGTGKSRSMTALTKELGIPVHALYGHYTPVRFFMEMFMHKDKSIIVEESASLQNDPKISEMFRTGFYPPRVVGWQSTQKNPCGVDSFNFEGSSLMGTNFIGNVKNPHVRASLDRFIVVNVRHTTRQKREKQKHKREYTPNDTVFEILGNRIQDIRNGHVKLKLSQTDYDWIDQVLDAAYTDNTGLLPDTYDDTKSIRDAERIEHLAHAAKQLFGSLEDPEIKRIIRQLYNSTGIDPTTNPLSIFGTSGTIKYGEVVNQLVAFSEEPICKRTAYRQVRRMLEQGKIEKEGNYLKIKEI